MQARVLTLEEIRLFAAALLPGRRVMAPAVRDGVTGFAWVRDPAEIRLAGRGIPRIPPKAALLPRSEALFYYRTGKSGAKVEIPPPPEPQVLLGVHPCDARAIKVLDAVFGAPPHPDDVYLARRRATRIVGMGAPAGAAPASCFFEEMGISPMDSRDCDMFFAPIGNGLCVAETLTDEGRELAGFLPPGPDASPDDLRRLAALRAEAAARVSERFSSARFQARLERLFESSLWTQAGERCVACGACAFLCPTCHCFDIQDETRGGAGCRVRHWDTCQFDLFTRHASGHNPRSRQDQRVRQRVFHKFDYGRKNFGLPFCVGCGRCIEACPVHNDLRVILERAEASAEEIAEAGVPPGAGAERGK